VANTDLIIKFVVALYFERGCGEKMSIWLKAWAGGVTGAAVLISISEVSRPISLLKKVNICRHGVQSLRYNSMQRLVSVTSTSTMGYAHHAKSIKGYPFLI
jgi:hypothetical protein